MKKELNKFSIKKSSVLFAPLFALVIAGIAPPARAAVRATLFDPPLRINAWSVVVNSNDLFNVLPLDFNTDDAVDFRFAYGLGGIEAYFNAPVRVATRTPPFIPGVLQPGIIVTIDSGFLGAVPLNSHIGTNIVSPGATTFTWSPGHTNLYDLTQPLGDHEITVASANVLTPLLPSPVISFSSDGTPVTNNIVTFPLATGDVVNREGVMAVTFYLDGQPHFGYIHFDFRIGAGGYFGGTGGIIYGWAYETEPNVAIKAEPLSTSRTRFRMPHPPTPIIISPGKKPPITAQPQ